MSGRGWNVPNPNDLQGLRTGLGLDYPGSTIHRIVGAANGIDSADPPVDVWNGWNMGGTKEYTYSSTANIDSLSSSSAADTGLVRVNGLDANGSFQSQFVSLNGTTTIILPIPLLRIFSILGLDASAWVGTVYAYINGATVVAGVPTVDTEVRMVGEPVINFSQAAIFTTPVGFKTFLIDSFINIGKVSAGSAREADLGFRFRTQGTSFTQAATFSLSSDGAGLSNIKQSIPSEFPPLTDIMFTVNLVSANDTTINIAMTFLSVPN